MVAFFVLLQRGGLCRSAYSTIKDSCKKCKNEFKKIDFYSGAIRLLHPPGFSLRRKYVGGLLLGSTGLGTLGTVFRTALSAVLHTCGIECAANDVIAYTGEVFYTAAAYKHD